MPKENIERAIKKAYEKTIDNFKEVLFEGYAPHGIAILVETATDNKRTVANLKAISTNTMAALAHQVQLNLCLIINVTLGLILK